MNIIIPVYRYDIYDLFNKSFDAVKSINRH